jgi:hypothetical protein
MVAGSALVINALSVKRASIRKAAVSNLMVKPVPVITMCDADLGEFGARERIEIRIGRSQPCQHRGFRWAGMKKAAQSTQTASRARELHSIKPRNPPLVQSLRSTKRDWLSWITRSSASRSKRPPEFRPRSRLGCRSLAAAADGPGVPVLPWHPTGCSSLWSLGR